MNDLCVDTAYRSINKFGEQLCGDCVQLIKDGDTTVLVLADGLGSGVKASILSTLTSKIISTMIKNKMTVDECVRTIAQTLPVCKTRGIAYSTFTIIKISNNTDAELIQFDNPFVILLREGKNFDYPKSMREIDGKTIWESKIPLCLNDVFIAMSDGAVYAGTGDLMNYGWQRENIVRFAEENYDMKHSANVISSLVLDKCSELYDGRPGDDTTVAAVLVRRRKVLNLIFGPPKNPQDVPKMMALFFAKQGRHVVCGGTTSTLTAQYLNKPLETSIDYLDPEIPPTAKIEGVDLVTEGVLTVSRVVRYAEDYLSQNSSYNEWSVKDDGASRLAKLLFEEATDINFYVGRAINPAHQNPDLPINFSIKISLINELAECLEKMGKRINVSYF